MKKIVLFFLIIFSIFSILINMASLTYVSANVIDEVRVYKIYDENSNLLFERDEVELGDNYLSKDFKYYEVISLDKERMIGIAKFIKNVEKPKTYKSNLPVPIKVERRVIAMYMTHNDESYVPTDGVDSVYGNGGIKDVALAFKSQLEKNFVDVYFDDTLHIPHDTSAYSRSLKTAQSLQNAYSPDAIFDIHRDGASRSYYIANVDGKERGRVRIVIGKANPNMALNEEFATYLMAVGNELYPWLFTDIYYAKGHYNQSLDSKAILFEMGSHLVEKDLVIDSMKELSEVVTTALYNTTVDSASGDLTINGVDSETSPTINVAMDKKEDSKMGLLVFCITMVILSAVCSTVIVVLYKNIKKKNKTN